MKKKTAGVFSVKMKVVFSVFLAVLSTIIIFLLTLVPFFKRELSDSVENNMLDLATAYGSMIDRELEEQAGEMLSADDLKGILEKVSIEGVSSSYVYLVSSEGTMLYHPTASKIGQPVENSVVKSLADQIKSGQIPGDSTKRYEYNGINKYASWHISTVDHSILVVTADETDIFQILNSMYEKSGLTAVFLIAVMAVLAYFVGLMISRPIQKVTEQIEKISKFNFIRDDRSASLAKRKDETGFMCSAVENMRGSMQEMLQKISAISSKLDSNAQELEHISVDVNANSSDNSATTQQLAAGMEETSATAELIRDNLIHVGEQSVGVKHQTAEGSELAVSIMQRAVHLKKNTEDASNRTKNIYSDVKEKTSEAIGQSKAVEKIFLLTETIKKISSRTGLLSLNASIEAARAGASGRGFAVVASEIGTLASQSKQAVDNITEIVREVQQAVSNMAGCLETTLDFLEHTVLNDYSSFIEISTQYSEDAGAVEASMRQIQSSMGSLGYTIQEISDSVSGISTTITEAAASVSDIAEKTSNTVSSTARTSAMAEENVTFASELEHIVNRFQL